MELAKIVLASSSSLKQDKSSNEPPPLAIIKTSTLFSKFAFITALIKDWGASSPCTIAG